MQEPIWLTRVIIDAVHLDQLREHGGMLGLRDENALESALARPWNKWHYEPSCDLATLASAYGYALARNHPYCDGNKRIAFLAMYVFLALNELELEASEEEVVRTILAVAAGRFSERKLAEWVRKHAVPLPDL